MEATASTRDSGVRIDRNVIAEMRNGIELRADVYRRADGVHPAILLRTPYDKNEFGSVGLVNPLDAVEQGFVVIVQDVRGRFASDGRWEPFVNEADDGYDTVEWVADQPWCNGRVGALGHSYLGLTAWQIAIADPPHLEAVLPAITGANYHNGCLYTGGAFELSLWLEWATRVAGVTLERMPASERTKQLQSQYTEVFDTIEEQLHELPILDVPVLTDELAFYYKDWLEHPSYDEYWERIDVTEQISSVSVPVLEIGGYYDAFARGAFDVAAAIETDGSEFLRANHHLVVGPWHHTTFLTGSTFSGEKNFGFAAAAPPVLDELVLPWFGHHLNDEENHITELPRIRYFQMGENEWRNSEEYPPTTATTTYYLDSACGSNTRFGDGQLVRSVPESNATADWYLYDPLDPVPTTGGNNFMLPPGERGVKDQSELEEREDVLVYTSPRLTELVSIVGQPEATLFVASSAPDTDFTAKLIDVEPDGYCANVSEGILRARYRNSMTEPTFMTPGETHEVSIELWPTAHTFNPHHRLRVEISSSNFPRFDRNPNTKTPVAEAAVEDMQTATNRIFHDADRPSNITLPIANQHRL